MSNYRNRGLEVVVDTTLEAERDFQFLGIAAARQEKIAEQLKRSPETKEDAGYGSLRFRRIDDHLVASFIISVDNGVPVVTIFGVLRKPDTESWPEFMGRVIKSGLPKSAQVLLEGRRPKQ